MTAPGKRRAKAGLTLIELLIALGLTGAILVPAGALLIQSFANVSASEQQNSAQQNARHAVDLIADDMKGAIPVSTLVAMGGTTATLPTNTVMGATLYPGTPTNITSSAPLYFNINNDTGTVRRVRYWLQGTNLRREIVNYVDEVTTPGTPETPTSGMVVAQNVTTFTALKPLVALYNYNTIRIKIVSAQGTGSDTSSVTIQSDITLRNNLISASTS